MNTCKEHGLQRASAAAVELDDDLQVEPKFQSVKRVCHSEPILISENLKFSFARFLMLFRSSVGFKS